MNKLTIIAYTDGSCYAKIMQGGFGVVLLASDGRTKTLSMGYNNTSVNRMELMAVMAAIKSVPKDRPTRLEIYSDSEYVVKSFTEGRVWNWMRNDFAAAKNADLWRETIALIESRPYMDFNIEHVYGHETDSNEDHIVGNTYADELADYKSFSWRKLDSYNDEKFIELLNEGVIEI